MAKYFLMPRAIVELALWSALWSALILAGCQKQPQRVLVPPPPAPAAQPAPPTELAPPPPVETPASPTVTTLPSALPSTAELPPAPPIPPAPKAKKPSRVKKEAAPPPAVADPPAPTQAPQPPPDPPQLGEVLSPQDTTRLNADIDRAIRNAQASLGTLAGKTLTDQQQSAAAQAKSFLQQASEVRSQDPASARSLAQRAEIIARDLASRVK